MSRNGSLTRRSFIPATAIAFAIVPRRVLGGVNYKPPSETLNIAAVGVGGMGKNYVKGCESENIVAIADVDDALAAPVFARYPKARAYRDFRIMLEKEKGIDAVIIGTPDHTHAVVAMTALKLGKHVYCAKPMTRTIHEARAITRAARDAKLATQMSVQSCASDAALSTVEWIQSGAVGPVREVHVWTNRPVWPQAVARPQEAFAVRSSLDWDLWLGPAPKRPYHPAYHPFNFRGWRDFGTGALGDMACHAFHLIFQALDLGYPTSVSASTSFQREYAPPGSTDMSWTRSRVLKFPETFPASSIVTWDFPARGRHQPARMVWYDGGLQPPRPADMDMNQKLPSEGLLFIGEKGIFASGFSGGPRFLTEAKRKAFTPPPKSIPRTIGHYIEWIQACKGGKPAACNFEFGSLLTETALLGVIAQCTGKFLVWDKDNMRFSNDADANQYVSEPYRSGWSL